MKSWEDTEKEILEHVKNTVPEAFSRQAVQFLTEKHTLGNAILNAFISYIRRKEVRAEYSRLSDRQSS